MLNEENQDYKLYYLESNDPLVLDKMSSLRLPIQERANVEIQVPKVLHNKTCLHGMCARLSKGGAFVPCMG